MNNKRILIFSVIGLLAFSACKDKANSTDSTNDGASKQLSQDISYVLGYNTGRQLNTLPGKWQIDAGDFIDGLKAGLDSSITAKYSDAQIDSIIKIFQEKMIMAQQQKSQSDAAANLAKGQQFMAKYNDQPSVKQTESGMLYKVIKEGSGKMPKSDSAMVKVHYEGRLPSGKVFDSSYKRGQPAKFQLNKVIPGWTEALQYMKEGAVYEWVIPGPLAYGERGSRGIPPNQVLIFKIELIEVL